MIHVLVGETEYEQVTRQAEAEGESVPWIVPKKAKPGETVLLFFPHMGFLGRGEIMSKPVATVFGRRQTYKADVGNIALFESSVPLGAVAEQFPAWKWTTYPRSFTTPKPGVADELLDFLRTRASQADVSLPEEVPPGSSYIEGSVQPILVNRYERDSRAREDCIRHYGTTCFLCGFDFVAKYGKIMAGFIHVHHLIPISDVGTDYEIDPIQDLRPVCPNCHAVLHHHREPPYSLEEVLQLLREAKGTRAT